MTLIGIMTFCSGGDYFPYQNNWKSLRSHVHIKDKLAEDLNQLAYPY